MKRALYQTTRRLTQDEVNDMMRDYPRPEKLEPVIRIRTVFLAVFAAGLFCGLIIADPLARMVEVMP